LQFQTPLMQATTTTVVERAMHADAQAVALTGSTARAKRTAISDLDYHVVGVRPAANDLPADVDIYAGKSEALWTAMKEGLLGGTLSVFTEERARGGPSSCCMLDWI
jgi:hypothetical protein